MVTHYAYWASTALLSLLYLTSATLYLARSRWVRQQLAALGYPGYLVPLLAAAKVLAVGAVLWRGSVPLSDLAYAGMFFHLLLAALAHIAVRKPQEALPAVLGIALLVVSMATQNAARTPPSPYGVVASAVSITGHFQKSAMARPGGHAGLAIGDGRGLGLPHRAAVQTGGRA